MGYVPPTKPEASRYRNRVNPYRWRKLPPLERSARIRPHNRAQQRRQEHARKGKTIDKTV